MSFGNSLILHAKSYCVSTSSYPALGLNSTIEFFALEFAQGDIDGGTTFSVHLKVLKT